MVKELSLVLVLVLVAVALLLIGLGWRNRLRRQADIPALPEAPDALGPALAEAEGQYVATTTAGDWLDRIAVHGLGLRTNAGLSVHRDGVLLTAPARVRSSSRWNASPASARKAAWPASSWNRTGSWS